MLALTNLALCSTIAYLALCRITRMNADTRRVIRYSVSLMAAGAVAAGIAPLVWGMIVHPSILIMEAGHAAFLIACKRLWVTGTPIQFKSCAD